MKKSINFPDEFPKIETKRLSLSSFEPEDVNNFFDLRSNEEFVKYLGLQPMSKKSAARDRVDEIIQDFKVGNGISWKISLKNQTALIGYIGFWKIFYPHFLAEIGFGIEKSHQKKGLMSEAMKEVLSFGFQILGLHRIDADIDPKNRASAALLKKFGFQKEGLFRENYYFEGNFLDSEYHGLLVNDFESIN